MMTDTAAGRDAGLMAAADGLMDAIGVATEVEVPSSWREDESGIAAAVRDAIYAALAAERRRAEADMRERAAQAIEDASADAHPVVRDAFNLIVRGLRTLPLTTETDHG